MSSSPSYNAQERVKLLGPSPGTRYDSIPEHPFFESSFRSRTPTVISRVKSGVRNWIGVSGIDVRLNGKRRWRGGRKRWVAEEISGDAMVLPLLITTFSAALADAITLGAYSTFATSMTGNTVLLAMSLVGASTKSPLYAGVSLAGFVGFGLLFGQLGALIGHRRRIWLISTSLFQILILLSMSIISHPLAHPSLRPGEKNGWIYLFLLSVQGGPQVTSAANAGARELPTAMMTTPYAAFISDPTLFWKGIDADVRSRNRRFIYIMVFWLGAIVGAVLWKWSTLSLAALSVAGCKLGVLVYLVLCDGEEAKQENAEEVRSTGPTLQPQLGHPERVTHAWRRRESRDEHYVAM